MRDERSVAFGLLGRLEVTSTRPLMLFLASLLAAALAAWLPDYVGLGDPGRHALFILTFAAALWMTEAIPAFAVSLVVMALGLLLLEDVIPRDELLAPWASPVIWLFFGGFMLAAAAGRSGLDRWLSGWVLNLTGNRPPMILLGVMGTTFTFSMFMSNTATATMMLSVLMPLLVGLHVDYPLRKSLPLGVAFAANIGGMGTIIGSPPNAIAAGLLEPVSPVNFVIWSAAALPPALLLAALAWLFLRWRYPAAIPVDLSAIQATTQPSLPLWQRLTLMSVFAVTVLLWMTAPLHGLPTAVVSFLPITVLTMTRTVKTEDIREMPWDVLLLIAGGLSLGELIDKTGLANYLVGFLAVDDLGPIALVLGLAWACSALSNFMSNTAAANLLLPLAIALTGGRVEYVMPIALAASSAMCLPVSTPPNALVASRAGIAVRDFLPGGLLIALATVPLVLGSCLVVFG